MSSPERELSLVLKNISVVADKMQSAMHDAAEEIATLLEGYAKSHHLWKPITGQTDVTTTAQIVEETEQHILIALSAGTEWAQFLELARQGRFAWLFPAVDANREACMRILQHHLSGIHI